MDPALPVPGHLERRIQAIDQGLSALQPATGLAAALSEAAAAGRLPAWEHDIRHELSPCFPPPPADMRAAVEREAADAALYVRWLSTLADVLAPADVCRLVSTFQGCSGAPRTTPVWLRSTDGKTRLPMVAPELASARLVALIERLGQGGFGDGVKSAAQVLVLINNAHAFTDGNGRLGRALFNYCLHRSGMPHGTYLPLKTISILSQGGYEVRLRQAELQGEWEGVLAYHCAVVELCLRVSAPVSALA